MADFGPNQGISVRLGWENRSAIRGKKKRKMESRLLWPLWVRLMCQRRFLSFSHFILLFNSSLSLSLSAYRIFLSAQQLSLSLSAFLIFLLLSSTALSTYNGSASPSLSDFLFLLHFYSAAFSLSLYNGSASLSLSVSLSQFVLFFCSFFSISLTLSLEVTSKSSILLILLIFS